MLTRRTFGAAIATLATSVFGRKADPAEPERRERPWAKRAEELEPVHGHWADFAAWQEWIQTRWSFDDEGLTVSMDMVDETGWYVLCCELVDGEESMRGRAKELEDSPSGKMPFSKGST